MPKDMSKHDLQLAGDKSTASTLRPSKRVQRSLGALGIRRPSSSVPRGAQSYLMTQEMDKQSTRGDDMTGRGGPQSEVHFFKNATGFEIQDMKINSAGRDVNTTTNYYQATPGVLSLLDELSPVQSARYNSNYSTNIGRRRCTAKTREKIIQDLKDWAGKKGGEKVYWMNGMAGTGKTTIGYSLCEWLAKGGKLGGNFFCSRAEPSCRDANNIVPTLAFQLSRSCPAYRSALCKVLKEEPQASKLEVRWQFQKLIEGPIRAVKETVLEDTVIVVDALDECEDGEAFRLFLETLLKLAPDLPFKIFLTSRPEPVIRQRLLAPGCSRSVLHLHDIEESVVEADIKTYLTDALDAMSSPPSSGQVEQLAKRSGRLFIYAATAVRYILPASHTVDSAGRLERVSSLTAGSGKQHEELDKIYMSVLSAACHDGLEPDEIDSIRLTLWTVVCARGPVSLKTIASLLPLTKDALQIWLGLLRSVLDQ